MRVDIQKHVATAEAAGRIGRARKIANVDARPALVGEVIETRLKDEGRETTSPPAQDGDMVVRNLTEKTGFEEYLVLREIFVERYDGPLGPGDKDPWRRYRPRKGEMLFFIVTGDEAPLEFKAPWGGDLIAQAGDAIVQDPSHPEDTYRVAADAFAATYEVVEPAGNTVR